MAIKASPAITSMNTLRTSRFPRGIPRSTTTRRTPSMMSMVPQAPRAKTKGRQMKAYRVSLVNRPTETTVVGTIQNAAR